MFLILVSVLSAIILYLSATTYHVYIPGGYDQLTVSENLNLYAISINNDPNPECHEMMSQILCKYYFAPCVTTVNGIHLPISLCQPECEYVRDKCLDTWMTILRAIVEQQDFETIDCNNTLPCFHGFSACCSGFGINNSVHNGKFLCKVIA